MGRFSALVPALVACGLAAAQEEAGSENRFLVFAEEMDLEELMSFWVQTKGLNLQYDREELAGPVTLRTTTGVTEETLWAVTNRELVAQGLACVQGPGEENLSIVALEQAASLARIEPVPEEAEAGFIRALASVEHVELQEAAGALAKLVGPGGSVVELRESSQVLLAGLGPQVVQALSVLDGLDRPPGTPVFFEIALEHASPVAVASQLERAIAARKKVAAADLSGTALPEPESGSILVVAPAEELVEWHELVRRFDREQPAVTRHYVPRRFGLEETRALVEETVGLEAKRAGPSPWRVVADGLTGTLIVTGTPADHERLEALFQRLEETPADRWSMRAFAVQHRRVEELMGLLEGLLEAEALPSSPAEAGSDEGALEPPSSATGGAVVRGRNSLAGRLTIATDPTANRLIAVGEARLLDQVERLVADLDQPFPQVLVEAMVVTLTESEILDLGVEMQKLVTDEANQIRLASLFGLGSPDPTAALIPPPGGTGGAGVVLDPGDFSLVVRALETLNEGRTLHVPRVLVSNNEDATLSSVVQTPFTSTNASQTVATTSFGGTFDAGTSITVTPQIAAGDRLILSTTISLSTFTGDPADPSLPPPRQESSVKSVVTIPDGHAVVLGGLDMETETEAQSRVPLLGDLPLVGRAFQSSSTSRTRTRFFVFLRCSVLRKSGFEDLRYVSAASLREAGLDDGFPVLEPRVMR